MLSEPGRLPHGKARGPYDGTAGIPLSFDATSSSGAEGVSLTYAWDFNASNGYGLDAFGPTPLYTYGNPGVYTVTLRVTDGSGCKTVVTTTANVAALWPTTANIGAVCPAVVKANPFNRSTTLTFTTQRLGSARITMFDATGRLVRKILDEHSLAPGVHNIPIDGLGSRGERLSSGVYLVRGVSADGVFTKSLVILK